MSKETQRGLGSQVVTRRNVLRLGIAGAASAVGALAAACGFEARKETQAAPEESPAPVAAPEPTTPFAVGRPAAPGQTPSSTREATAAPAQTTPAEAPKEPTKAAEVPAAPTKTPEPMPTPEPKPEIFKGVTLTSEFLERKMLGRGGGAVSLDGRVVGAQETMLPTQYTDLAWRRELQLAQTVDKLRLLVAQGAQAGADGLSFHFLNAYPELKEGDIPLRLFRFKLNTLPGERAEVPIGAQKLNPGTDITVICGDAERTVVAFTDYRDAAQNQGVPAHFLAVISTLSREAGDLSLESFVAQRQDMVFSVRDGVFQIGFEKEDGKKAIWEMNTASQEFAAKLGQASQEDLAERPTVPKEGILQIETLETTWNPELKRWEYYDTQLLPGEYRRPEDSKIFVGWWNEQDKRFEVSPDLYVLRARWKGLYVPWTAADAELEFQKTVDIVARKARVPIPTDFTQGEVIRGNSAPGVGFFGFHKVPIGTFFYAPFSGEIEEAAAQDVSSGEWTRYVFLKGPVVLKIEFKTQDDYLGGASTTVGERLIRFSDKVISKVRALVPNPGDYQIRCLISSAPDVKSWGITFKDNILLDEKGRVVYIG